MQLPQRQPLPTVKTKKCLSKNIVYKATVENSKVNYVGMTTTTFKARLSNHIYSFKTYAKRKSTTIATYVWENNLNPKPNIKWKMLKQCRPYSPGQIACDVCISEKVEIIAHCKDPKNINKKNRPRDPLHPQKGLPTRYCEVNFIGRVGIVHRYHRFPAKMPRKSVHG